MDNIMQDMQQIEKKLRFFEYQIEANKCHHSLTHKEACLIMKMRTYGKKIAEQIREEESMSP